MIIVPRAAQGTLGYGIFPTIPQARMVCCIIIMLGEVWIYTIINLWTKPLPAHFRIECFGIRAGVVARGPVHRNGLLGWGRRITHYHPWSHHVYQDQAYRRCKVHQVCIIILNSGQPKESFCGNSFCFCRNKICLSAERTLSAERLSFGRNTFSLQQIPWI